MSSIGQHTMFQMSTTLEDRAPYKNYDKRSTTVQLSSEPEAQPSPTQPPQPRPPSPMAFPSVDELRSPLAAVLEPARDMNRFYLFHHVWATMGPSESHITHHLICRKEAIPSLERAFEDANLRLTHE